MIPVLIFGFFAFWALVSANALLTAACGLTLAVLFGLLWRPGEPPILLFAACMQWLQVSTKVIQGNLTGQSVETMFGHPIITEAVLMCLAGIAVLGFAMRLTAGAPKPGGARFVQQLGSISLNRLLVAYIVAYFASTPLSFLVSVAPGLYQALLVLMSIRWFFYFVLACAVLYRGQGCSYLIFAFLLELLAGLGGFFSDFKQVFFVTGIAYLTVRPRISLGTAVVAGGMAACLLVLAVFWTAVKMEYRTAINEGRGGLELLYEMARNQNEGTLTQAVNDFGSRLAYVDYFALSMLYVPQSTPHTNGQLWLGAVRHLVPRMLDPDKPVLDDTVVTMRYTGEEIAEGTSVSIGYMGESYIDFGAIGLYFPVFLLGLFWGKFYAYLAGHQTGPAYGYAAATMVLIPSAAFEIALPKLAGTIVTLFIVVSLWMNFVLPRIRSFLEASRDNKL